MDPETRDIEVWMVLRWWAGLGPQDWRNSTVGRLPGFSTQQKATQTWHFSIPDLPTEGSSCKLISLLDGRDSLDNIRQAWHKWHEGSIQSFTKNKDPGKALSFSSWARTPSFAICKWQDEWEKRDAAAQEEESVVPVVPKLSSTFQRHQSRQLRQENKDQSQQVAWSAVFCGQGSHPHQRCRGSKQNWK